MRDLSHRFVAGTTTLVLGPNGAGKSTLLAVLGGLLRPSEGFVWYEPLGPLGPEVRRQVGWVAHESRCYLDLTVRQNLELVARLRGIDGSEAWRHTAERFGLAGLADRKVRVLSRGERQRLAIGCAVVHDPSVLLLDEAWSGLDRDSSELLLALVCARARAGATVVVASHDQGLKERLGAVELRLERGRWAGP